MPPIEPKPLNLSHMESASMCKLGEKVQVEIPGEKQSFKLQEVTPQTSNTLDYFSAKGLTFRVPDCACTGTPFSIRSTTVNTFEDFRKLRADLGHSVWMENYVCWQRQVPANPMLADQPTPTQEEESTSIQEQEQDTEVEKFLEEIEKEVWQELWKDNWEKFPQDIQKRYFGNMLYNSSSIVTDSLNAGFKLYDDGVTHSLHFYYSPEEASPEDSTSLESQEELDCPSDCGEFIEEKLQHLPPK